MLFLFIFHFVVNLYSQFSKKDFKLLSLDKFTLFLLQFKVDAKPDILECGFAFIGLFLVRVFIPLIWIQLVKLVLSQLYLCSFRNYFF